MNGMHGELRVGNKVAAQLGEWHMNDGGRVEAHPLEVNDFWLNNGKHSLWLWLGTRAWVWNNVEIVDGGSPFIVHVAGSPVVRDV